MKKRLVIILLIVWFVLPGYVFAQIKTKTIYWQDGTEGIAVWDRFANIFAGYQHADVEAGTLDGIYTYWDNPDMLAGAFSNKGRRTNEFFFTSDGRIWSKEPSFRKPPGFKIVDFIPNQGGMSSSLEPEFPDILMLIYAIRGKLTAYGIVFEEGIGFLLAIRIVFDVNANPILKEMSRNGLIWEPLP